MEAMVLRERPGWRQALVRAVTATTRSLAAPIGAAVAVLGAGRLFTLWFWRRAAHLHPPAGIFVTVDGRRLHLVDRGPAGRPPDAAGPRPASPAPDTPAADDPPSARLDAPPTVVLVHGLRGSSAEFTFSIVDRLAERYRVLAVDRPGYGASDLLRRRTGAPSAQARALHAALGRLGVERPVLVGHSIGAALVMAYAVAYPDELGAAVTLSGHTLPFDGEFGSTTRLAELPVLAPLLLNTLATPLGLLAGPRILRQALSPQTPPPGYTAAALRSALQPKAFRAAADDVRECDRDMRTFFAHYGELTMPFVLVTGADDRHISPNESLTLHRLLRHSELREIEGSGHMPFFADPDAVVAAVDRACELARAGT